MDFNVFISSNEKKIIKSGSVILWDENADFSIKIERRDVQSDFVILKFVFVTKAGVERNIENTVEGSTMVLKCINFKDGVGTLKPFNIGAFKNDCTDEITKIYVHLRVDTQKDYEPVKVEYTIFAEENKDVYATK